MQLRPLGTNGPLVSVLGLGTVKLGRTMGVKYPTPFVVPTDGEARVLLDTARELGINLIDTAPAYGTSEERLGALIGGGGGAPGEWDGWIVCTKVGEEFDGGRSHYDFSAQAVRRSVERSLRRLKCPRLDVVLIHSDGRDAEILERAGAAEELERLRKSGLVGQIGMSTKTVAGALAAAERLDVIMVTLNPNETADLPAIARAKELGKGVLVKKALAQGHAVGGLAFAVNTPGVSSVVVGTINPEHLRENVRGMGQG